MSDASEIRAALEAVLQGHPTESDKKIVRKEFLDGRIVHAVGDRNVVIGGDSSDAVIITGDGAQVTLQITPEQIASMRDQILPTPRGIVPPLPSLVFVGRHSALDDVRRMVGVPNQGEGASCVVVRGWPGVGKTSLTNVLAHDSDLLQVYDDGILWTSLDQKPNLVSIFAGWGRALGREDLLRTPTIPDMATQLGALVRDKRMLLIVDDVWEPEHGALFQRIKGRNCGLLFTTREQRVAEALAFPAKIYALPVLTTEYAIRLLGILAPAVVATHARECEQLVEDLERLPLALQVAGRLLHSEQRLGWGIHELLADIRDGAAVIRASAPADRLGGETIPTVAALLQKSTDRLNAQTREYFAMLGAFASKPAAFDLDAMRSVWEADDPKPFVRELVGRGLLEPTPNGQFQMHALLKAHACSLLPEEA